MVYIIMDSFNKEFLCVDVLKTYYEDGTFIIRIDTGRSWSFKVIFSDAVKILQELIKNKTVDVGLYLEKANEIEEKEKDAVGGLSLD